MKLILLQLVWKLNHRLTRLDIIRSKSWSNQQNVLKKMTTLIKTFADNAKDNMLSHSCLTRREINSLTFNQNFLWSNVDFILLFIFLWCKLRDDPFYNLSSMLFDLHNGYSVFYIRNKTNIKYLLSSSEFD